jgi:hypothetical protein
MPVFMRFTGKIDWGRNHGGGHQAMGGTGVLEQLFNLSFSHPSKYARISRVLARFDFNLDLERNFPMQEDDDNQNLVLGILFGIIALVIGLVIGLTVYVTGQTNAAKAAPLPRLPTYRKSPKSARPWSSSTSIPARPSCPPMRPTKWPRSSPSCRKIPARSC